MYVANCSFLLVFQTAFDAVELLAEVVSLLDVLVFVMLELTTAVFFLLLEITEWLVLLSLELLELFVVPEQPVRIAVMQIHSPNPKIFFTRIPPHS